MYMPAGEFKAKCLKLMEDIKTYGKEITITKHGKPVAKLVPVDSSTISPKTTLGCMRGTAEITGNIIDPIDAEWNFDEKNI